MKSGGISPATSPTKGFGAQFLPASAAERRFHCERFAIDAAARHEPTLDGLDDAPTAPERTFTLD
jgi:hypothetical protein